MSNEYKDTTPLETHADFVQHTVDYMQNYPRTHVDVHMFLARRSALKLEIAGMHHSRGSVYKFIKDFYGWSGSRQAILDKMDAVRDHLLRRVQS